MISTYAHLINNFLKIRQYKNQLRILNQKLNQMAKKMNIDEFNSDRKQEYIQFLENKYRDVCQSAGIIYDVSGFKKTMMKSASYYPQSEIKEKFSKNLSLNGNPLSNPDVFDYIGGPLDIRDQSNLNSQVIQSLNFILKVIRI